ncbi:MAG: cyclic nucleotide-binding domain-containing protein [Dehalococcoidales bacterium]|nr:cyclic nucleotide-binding domain-containing protein [Dehalococcoidales bacterium]MDP7286007.1 cyclic nucleotide-binding domain-containing protein [Dehalococcoidales bacterium]MDP7415496.1 cyclic nucleotide-binding domain-containing protein [Dehalococcoidales bacterium]
MTKLEVLKRCPFVRELDDEQLKMIAEIGAEEVYEVGERLCKQGRTQEKLYLIEDGLVGLHLELGPMTHRQLQAASNFEVIAWSALMSPYRSHTTVKAIETTRVLAFNGKELAKMCENHPVIGSKVYRGLASVIATRLENAFAQLMGVTAQD